MTDRSVRGDRQERGALRALTCIAMLTAVLVPFNAAAEVPGADQRPTLNFFGMTGLIDMPTAEMQPDGQFSITSSYFAGFQRNTLSAQILPGVEAAFRYSVLDELAGSGNTLYDRSFDVKLRLVEEGPIWPAVVVGLQDFLGTGIYAGEYVAATRRLLGGNLKLTGGIGWGRFTGANPLDNPICVASDRFCDRERKTGRGGQVEIKSFFTGEDLGFFGGVEWQTPIDGLTFKAEYSDDDYDREEDLSGFDREIPLNFGLEYRPLRGIELGAYYMYGADFGLRLTLSGNPFRPLAETDGEPAPPPVQPRPGPDEASLAQVFGEIRSLATRRRATTPFSEAAIEDVDIERRDGVRWAAATLPPSADYVCPDEAALAIDAEFGVVDAVTFRHADGTPVCMVALRPEGQHAIQARVRSSVRYPTGWHADPAQRAEIVARLVETLDPERIGLFGIEIDPERVAVYIENKRYRAMPRAIGRTARALTATMPPSVVLFEIIPVEGSLPVVSVMLERAALEEQVERPDAARDAWLTARVRDAAPPGWSEVEGTLGQYPRPYGALNPYTPFNVFDPDQPFRVDLSARAEGGIELIPGLSVNGTVQKRLIGNLDDIERESDSVLPRVRSNIANYLREGDPGLSRLTADYVTKLDDAAYGRLSVGYLEWMHGGVSGELLWKEANRSWGVGLELNWTRQRDFDMLFGFQDYDVVTGHASLYWDTDFHDLSVQIDAGRYLAGDWGTTFSLTRRFPNGWELGGFFTLTDVPFDEFGEGSFDKGIILTIPFNWMLPFESRSEYRAVLKPLTRDGGQRLQVDNRLYPLVEDVDRSGLRTDWESFWE